SRAAQLEARIAALESIVGHQEAGSEPLKDGIAPVVAKLEEQLQLVTQPRQMEIAVRRAKTLTSELERLQRLKEQDAERLGISAETEKKIDQLFSTLDQLDPLIPLAPVLVERLKSLQQLHTRAATFAEAVLAVEQEQARLEGSVNDATEQSSKVGCPYNLASPSVC
ncbi:Dynamitin-domain-containing protein, partial [Thamnocephalis sphaerospora]